MLTLRPYQTAAVASLRANMKAGDRRLVLCAPTGAGKTVMFSYMVSAAVARQKKCLIITHRAELLTQAGGALRELGLIPVEIKPGAGAKYNHNALLNRLLCVGMAQTLKRRIADGSYTAEIYAAYLSNLDLVIIDEAHTQDAEKLLPYFGENTTVIGATATPHREANQSPMDGFYNSITEVATIRELIRDGYLSKPRSYGVRVDLTGIKTKAGEFDAEQVGNRFSEVKLYRGVYENYMRLAEGKKAIIFASNVASSIELVEDFKARGLPIEHIDGTTPPAERKRILNWFKITPGAMVSNVGILNAGFDESTIEVVILYRATKSLPLFLQMCGRGSRTNAATGKTEFLILDFGNNISRHGFWEEERRWSLKPAKKKKEGAAPVKECPECAALLHTTVKICNFCGHVFEPTEKEREEAIIAELRELTYSDVVKVAKTADFDTLERIAAAKGYKRTWVYHQLATENDIRAYAESRGYHPRWIEHQIALRQERATH